MNLPLLYERWLEEIQSGVAEPPVSLLKYQRMGMAAEMTAFEKIHFENVKRLWKEDGGHPNWTLHNETYRCKVRKEIFQWFEFRLRHGWHFIPKEDIIT